jgi:hypothetical protein
LSADGAFSVNFGALPYFPLLMAGHERLFHVKIVSKSTSAIISNPNGNSRLNAHYRLIVVQHVLSNID